MATDLGSALDDLIGKLQQEQTKLLLRLRSDLDQELAPYVDSETHSTNGSAHQSWRKEPHLGTGGGGNPRTIRKSSVCSIPGCALDLPSAAASGCTVMRDGDALEGIAKPSALKVSAVVRSNDDESPRSMEGGSEIAGRMDSANARGSMRIARMSTDDAKRTTIAIVNDVNSTNRPLDACFSSSIRTWFKSSRFSQPDQRNPDSDISKESSRAEISASRSQLARQDKSGGADNEQTIEGISSRLGVEPPVKSKQTLGAPPILDGIWHDLSRASTNDSIQHNKNIRSAKKSVRSSLKDVRRSNSLVSLGGLAIRYSQLMNEGLLHQAMTCVSYMARWCTAPLSPYGRFRLVWDAAGIVLVVYDVITVPLDVAWDRDKKGLEVTLFQLGIVFWTLDMLLTCNTGFIRDGKLEKSRKAMLLHYARTWMAFDLLTVALDYFFLFLGSSADMMAMFRAARAIRIVRVLRIIRILKFKKFSIIVDNLCFRYSLGRAALIAAIFKTLFFIVVSAHVGGCLWFYIGMSAIQAGGKSWLSSINYQPSDSIVETYSMSLHYTLAHLTAAPADGKVSPHNAVERIFSMFSIVTSLLILGTAISKISRTIHELNKNESELADTRRELQRYFKATASPMELSVRVLHFVEECHHRMYTLAINPNIVKLLSDSLAAEITLNARSKFISDHPLFGCVRQTFEPVYSAVCGAFDGTVHANHDVVFQAGTWSSGLLVMAHGVYTLKEVQRLDAPEVQFDTSHWFCEVSLFSRTIHRSTLESVTFSNSYTLSARNFAECVKMSPVCTVLIIEYAQAFLNSLWDGELDSEPRGKHVVDDMLPKALSEAAVEAACKKEDRVQDLEIPPTSSKDDLQELVAGICAGTLRDDDVNSRLPCVFGELDPSRGLYVQAKEELEEKRVKCAMLSVFWLLGDRYESFIECQPEATRMSRHLWNEWQDFLHYADLNEEMVHVLLVFLCIRGLCKSKSLARMVDLSEWAAPSQVLNRLMEMKLLTSVDNFDDAMYELLQGIITINEAFNLPQFLQAENLPYHVDALKTCIQKSGPQLFKCYLVALTCMMCGLSAGKSMKGSLFMDSVNGRAVLLGIKCLKQVGTASPKTIYWSYISMRAKSLDYDTLSTPESHVVARIACLTRASADDLEALQDAWDLLTYAEHAILVKAFLSDGITMKAHMLLFLPLFFERAKNNPAVGLSLALEVLVNLLDLLKRETFSPTEAVIEVNLSDLASFTGDVRCPVIFRQIPRNTLFAQHGNSVRHLVNGELWSQVSKVTLGHESSMHELAHMLTKLERETLSIQKMLSAPNKLAELLDR